MAAPRKPRTVTVKDDANDSPLKRPGGRPSELTPQLTERICGFIKAGNYFSVACVNAGLSEKTGREWLARGNGTHKSRPSTPEFAEFADAIKKADAYCEAYLVQEMKEAGKGNWQFYMAMLERKYRERWGRLDALADRPERMSLDELLALRASLDEGDTT